MTNAPSKTMRRVQPRLRLTLALGCALLGSAPVQAGWLDGLLVGQAPTSANAKQRLWSIREFSRVELVAREAGAEANQHPAALQADVLRQLLAQVQVVERGAAQALFATDELAELAGPLVQALGRAGPGDDVLLLSSARREGAMFLAPTAVTARLFVQGGQLQLIVRDARFEFYDAYRGTHQPPRFDFGSRTANGSASLRSAGATNRRADWLSIPLVPVAVQASPAAPAAAPAAVAAPAAPPPAAAPVARKPLDAAGAEDIERRLETLKRLRDKGLITEEEYQHKRKEILQLL
jgi:hypothetical protein